MQGGIVKRVESWAMAQTFERPGQWTVQELIDDLAPLARED